MSETSIQWTHCTFNPWWGCTRVSPGCEHCYAQTFSHRLGLDLWGPKAARRFFDDKHWSAPMKWAGRRAAGDSKHLVFCASMADVFEDRRDLDESRHRLWNLIETTPELTWQLLTKRPENIDKLGRGEWTLRGWPPNVWMLVTAEDQERADRRIPILLRTGARVKGVSYEPALGPVDFQRSCKGSCPQCRGAGEVVDSEEGGIIVECPCERLSGLSWVIVGGESGPGARPFDVAWARSAVRQCREAGVACFVKQCGARIVGDHAGFNVCRWHLADGRVFVPPIIGPRVHERPADAVAFSLGSVKGGDMSEWPEDLRVREFPVGRP